MSYHHDDDEERRRALDALPPGACPLLSWVTTATVRHPKAGQAVEVTYDERDQRATAAMIGILQDGITRRGLPEVVALPRIELRHPADCPLCEYRRLPGPPVWGMWFQAEWAEGRHRPDALEEFANLDYARSCVEHIAEYFDQPRSRRVLQMSALRVWSDRTPRYEIQVASRDERLWLWHEQPAGDPKSWPAPDLVFSFADGQVTATSGAEAAARLARRAESDRPAAPSPFRMVQRDGHTLVYYREPGMSQPLLVSLHDHNSAAPARRVLADGSTLDLDEAPRGLTVFGRCVADRPPLADLPRLMPEKATLATWAA